MNARSDRDPTEALPGQDPATPAGERRIRVIDNRIDSRELFAATREISITHGSDTYRLRLTALNKLILTK